jgi:tRNA (cmo5U34)-methyltransferase
LKGFIVVDFTFAHREEGFDNHIENSIRGYSNLLEDVIAYSRYFVENETNVYDIGCSTGKLTQHMLEANQDFCQAAKYIGIEIAEGFFKDLEKRKKDISKAHPWASVEFTLDDIRNTDIHNASLVTSIFTLQFMPKKDRQDVINKIYNGLIGGGAYIFAEKTFSESARHQDMLTFNFYDYKRKSFSTEDIMDKENTLRHMMKPNTWTEIENMVTKAGFTEIQPFWRNHVFVGAIAIK